MEVEEETTSNHLEESIAPTVISEILLENTTSTDKQSEKELSTLVPKSNSQEEENSSVSVSKSQASEAFAAVAVGEKAEEVVVHCRNSESVAALSGGVDNSVVVESMSVVQDSKDGDDCAVNEIDVPSGDVAAVERGGSELTCSVNVDEGDGEDAMVETHNDPEVVEEKVENDGEDTNVTESMVIDKDENEGDEMVGSEGEHEDENETVKEVEVGDEDGVLLSSVVYQVTDQSKNDGDVQAESIDNLQRNEAVAEEPIVAEGVKEEEAVDGGEDPKEESLMANEETVDCVAENEEETMVEDDEKSLDTDIETEKSLDTEFETEEDANLADEEKLQETEIETEPESPESSKKGSGGKRKRGKISKTTPKSKKTIEEDVCFICFDGGDLVLCDRRNCPKAYHPSCVNRDEAFFQSKGSWNCGWHLCSLCEKKAEYMCYTCTYSSCKACIKTSVLLCVREKEKKGLCEACMRTVMLIENPENQENVNFEDESSWEHLFKDYWTETKEKHNLSLQELTQVKNQESPTAQDDSTLGSENISNNPKSRRSTRRQTKKPKYDDGTHTEWVSKDLLEFITHMRNGDTSLISQFEVQDLLLEYIKTNKLRDPNRKSQIICDTRLETLFGKPRVAHIEMLKLLESHFLVKEDDIQGSVVDDDETNETLEKDQKDKKRKGRKKGEKRAPQSNCEDYAAINIHNINLIYLRRKLVEDLIDDVATFREKIVGTFVRIRISGANQKQDMYRLVQVTGTTEAAEYTIGKRTTCTMLEILNLNKTEIISIDTISNQEFTEDECKRLRQSIKCGLISRLTVGDILDKAMELQVARVNDWLETEVVRLSHLRDRASDLGRKKELRECVEKLHLLKIPEERARRLEEFPLVHDDPTMDPEYESEDDHNSDDKRQELYKRSDSFRFNKRGRDHFSPRGDYNSKESWTGTPRGSARHYEFTRNFSNRNFPTKDETVISSFENTDSSRGQEPIKSESPNVQTAVPVAESGPKVNESEKLWHYKDPSGKIQGPFSMGQLRKWNKNGYFPARLKIWRKTENEDDGIFLTDALAGNFQNGPTQNPKTTGQLSIIPNSGSSGSVLVPCGNKDGSVSVAPQNVDQGQAVAVVPPQTEVVVPPQMVQSVSGQNPQGWSGGGQPNAAVNMAGMQQMAAYNQWTGGAPAMVQNPAGNFMPPQQFPFPVNQNMQQLPPQQSWGTMAANPNMAWVGPNPGWGPMVQGSQVTGTVDPTWVGPVAGWVPQPPVQTWVPAPVVGNGNPGWVGPVVNQGGGWGAPVANQNPNPNPNLNQNQGNMNTGWNQGAPMVNQGPGPGPNMGWVPPGGNQGQGVTPTTPTPTPAPPVAGNSNWGSPAAPRNQGNWEQQNRGGFSGQRRNRGSGSGFRGNRRNFNRQESFHGAGAGDSARSSDR